jgi:hypothetical protein
MCQIWDLPPRGHSLSLKRGKSDFLTTEHRNEMISIHTSCSGVTSTNLVIDADNSDYWLRQYLKHYYKKFRKNGGKTPCIIKRDGLSCNASDLYSEGLRFESRSGYRIPELRFVVRFSPGKFFRLGRSYFPDI